MQAPLIQQNSMMKRLVIAATTVDELVIHTQWKQFGLSGTALSLNLFYIPHYGGLKENCNGKGTAY